MAAPTVTARANSQHSAATTTHTVALPDTLNVGERIIVSFVSLGGGLGPDLTTPEGWDVIASLGEGGGSGPWLAIIEHEIDGEEDSTVTFGTTLSTVSVHRAWAGPFQPAIAAAPMSGTTGPASYPEVEVEQGDYLILAICGTQTGAQGMTISTPADYGEAFFDMTGNNGAALGTFERAMLGIESETPGDSTLSAANERWLTVTLALAEAEGGDDEGDISGAAALTFTADGTLGGAGVLAGQGSLTFAPTGALSGAGALAGAATLTFTVTGTPALDGAITGSTSLSFTPTGRLVGSGALTGAVDLTFTPAGVLAGEGHLSGSSSLTFTVTGVIPAVGALAGATALSFAAAGRLAGVGALAGETSLTFTVAAHTTPGRLSGSSTLIFDATGAIAGAGALAGTAELTFDAVGNLIDGSISITLVGDDDVIRAGQQAVAFTGTSLGADETDRTVELVQGGVVIEQEQGAGDATGGTFDVRIEGNLDLRFGDVTFRVRRSDAQTVDHAITLEPAAGELYADVTTPLADPGGRIRAIRDIAAGDQIHVRGRGGGAAPAGLTINGDGTFEFEAGSAITSFEVRVYSASDLIWRDFAVQYIAA